MLVELKTIEDKTELNTATSYAGLKEKKRKKLLAVIIPLSHHYGVGIHKKLKRSTTEAKSLCITWVLQAPKIDLGQCLQSTQRANRL